MVKELIEVVMIKLVDVVVIILLWVIGDFMVSFVKKM